MNTTGQISGTATIISSGAKVEFKTCSKCKTEKPLTEFYKKRDTKDGHRGFCKLCAKAKNKAYREANREKLNAKNKAYHDANREKIKAQKKAYREANREKIKAQNKVYYEANREEIKTQQKAYREANPEKIKAQSKAYHNANREKIIAKKKAYSQSPRGRFFRVRACAKQRGIEFLLTEEQVFELIKKPCTYCGKPGPSGIDRIDSNGVYTIENCEPCCWTCNTRKGTKSKEVFLQEIKEGKWN